MPENGDTGKESPCADHLLNAMPLARLQSAALEVAANAIVITDRDGVIVWVNPAFSTLTGYTPAEARGKNPRDLVKSGKMEREIYERLWETILAGRVWRGELVNRRKDGSLYPEFQTITPVRDTDGTLTHFIAIKVDLTETKLLEKNLVSSELRYRRLFETAKDGILILDFESGMVTDVNPFLMNLLGFPRSEFLEKRIWELGVFQDIVANMASFAELQRREYIRYEDKPLRAADGSQIDVEFVSNAYVAGDRKVIQCNIRDVRERKRTEVELELFRTLIDRARDQITVADPASGRFLDVNEGACRALGYTRAELLGLTLFDVTVGLDRARYEAVGAQLRKDGHFVLEDQRRRKDGTLLFVEVSISSLTLGREYLIAIARDITERKQLEDQFRQAQKMEAIGTLAGGIAHDFNNILCAIGGFTELAQMSLKDNPEVRGFLGATLQASHRATGLVRQILTFSRQQPQSRKIIQLQPILSECAGMLRASIPATIEIDTSADADAPTVLADANQVHQVIMNLGTNAWYAMRDHTGRLQLKLEKFLADEAYAATQIGLQPGLYARVSVGDTGCGMNAATLKRIFEPFFTTKPLGEGTGLGLSVVHGIMQDHEGVITVYSQPGEGTMFHLYFPARLGGQRPPPIDEAAVPPGHGERILFVDDDALLATLGQKTLTALGYEVESTTQPAVALAMVRDNPQHFSLVFTDQFMPGLTGIDLASSLLQIRPGLPIVLMSGYPLSLTPERVRAGGVRELLLKPITIRALATAASNALSVTAPRTAARREL